LGNTEDFVREYTEHDSSPCKEIIEWFESNQSLHTPGVVAIGDSRNQVDNNEKESTDICLPLRMAYQVPPIAKMMDVLWKSVNSYIEEFDVLQGTCFTMLENINIQKYTPPSGGYKAWHTERIGATSVTRMLVWMIYLNTVTDKGGTEFMYIKKTTNAEEGKIVLWPPDFTHLHRVIPSPTQEKYIMTGWYNFTLPQ